MKKGSLLLLFITLLIILIVCIFGYLNKQEVETPPIVETHVGGPLENVTDLDNYYMVKNCVNKFYNYYATMYENIDEDNIDKVYNLLDEKYINFNNLTKENVRTLLPGVRASVVNISNMYVSKQSENISIYIVEGVLRAEVSKELSDFQIMVQIDSKNETFSVLLQDYIESKHSGFAVGNNLKIEKLNNIEKNRNNLYVKEEISEQTYVKDLFNDYKEEILYNQELAYEHLDEEYRNEKFGTLENLSKYVINNKEYITNSKVEKYQKSQEYEYVQYVCVDENGRYYIFRENGLMSYSLLLDNYTVDIPEFLEKYNKSNTIEKAAYNVQRCIDAINYKDYEYVYNKLDFEFKALNYPTLESFEKAIKNKLFETNKVKEVSNYYEGVTHIFKLTITDTKDNKKEQNMTVIMQINQGTDFVMSLSFE